MTKIWGPITWELLHCLTLKINDSFFISNKQDILLLLNNILSCIPCPECSTHALLIYNNNKKKIINKTKLINFFHYLHNEVNKKLKKTIYDITILDRYKSLNIRYLLVNWINATNNLKSIPKLMANSMNNTFIKKKLFYI